MPILIVFRLVHRLLGLSLESCAAQSALRTHAAMVCHPYINILSGFIGGLSHGAVDHIQAVDFM